MQIKIKIIIKINNKITMNHNLMIQIQIIILM